MSQRRHVLGVIHGPYGHGKTTLANTMPGPRLVADVEGGSYDLPCNIILWSDFRADPTVLTGLPVAEQRKTSVVADVTDYESYREIMDYILGTDHPFQTFIIDSLTQLQKKIKAAIRGELELGENFQRASYDVWDQLLTFMDADIDALADARRPTHRKPFSTIIVAASNVEETPRRPILQGALRKFLPALPDFVGYLHTERGADPRTGEMVKYRVLDLEPDDIAPAEVKCRLRVIAEKHGAAINNPNLSRDIMRVLNTTEKENTDG